MTGVEITQSIRAMFGTAHILDVGPENSYDGESKISEAKSNTEDITDDNASFNIFICPLCGQDFSHIGSFSNHNKREHKNKVVRLEVFSYATGKQLSED